MKNILFKGCYIILLSCFAMHINAQSLEVKIKNLFAPLNKSEITSGIFMHQTPTFLKPSHFDGVNQADSMALDINKWGMLYGQFRGANTLSNSYLPNPSTYINPNRNGIINNTIPILVNVTQYHYIRQGAILDSLLSFENNQYHDVLGRIRSPYNMDTSFVCSTLFTSSKSKTVKFIIPDSFIFKNIDLPITNFEIKVGDGSGWQVISPNQLLNVNYSDTGSYIVKLRFQIDNTWKYCVTKILIDENNNNNRMGGGTYDIDNPEKVTVGDTEISIFSSCSDKKIRKPIIVFEGFPNKKTADDDLFPDILVPEHLDEWLNIREYDIIWVDWPNNVSSTAQNADRVIKVIEWVNNRKHNDGSNEPNTIIAASFGGPCTKYALLKMHNILNKNSEVDRYFTYDAALKGANFPVGLQAFIKDIAFTAGNLVGSVPSLVTAVEYVDGPAPKDLLINRVNLTVSGGVPVLTTGLSPFFLAIQNEIASMESIKPLNSFVRHIVLSNGADFGAPQELMPSKLMDLFFNIDWVAGEPWEPAYDVDMIVHSFADNGLNTTFYERNIRTKIYFDKSHIYIPPHVEDNLITLVGTPTGLDTAPGGNGDPGKKEVASGLGDLKSALSSYGQIDKANIDLALNQYCFVPTVSSLDLPIGTNFFIPSPSGGNSVDRFSLSQDASVLNMVTGRFEINQYHVTINPRIGNVIKNELDAPISFPITFPLSGSQIYNTGKSSTTGNQLPQSTPKNFAGYIEIKDNSQLWVNRSGKLGLQTSSNPNNLLPQTFVLSIPGSNCANDNFANVQVKDNSKIIVGDFINNSKSILGFGNNSNLSIYSNEGLFIDYQSQVNLSGNTSIKFENGGSGLNKGTINIYDKATLNIENGGFLNSEWGAKVYIYKGGKLHIKAGGTLRVSHYSQLIVEDGGQLIIEPGANIQLWDGNQVNGEAMIYIKGGGTIKFNGSPNYTGNGYFRFAPNNIIIQNAAIDFIGISRDHRLFYAELGAEINWKNVTNIEECKAVFENGSKMHCTGNFRYNFKNVNFESAMNYQAYAIGIHFDNSLILTIDNCKFNKLNTGIKFENLTSITDLYVLKNSIFENYEYGINVFNSSGLRINNTKFNGSNAIFADNVNRLYLVNNSEVVGNNSSNFDGIRLNNVSLFELNNSKIDGFQNGSGILGTNRVNVKMYSKAAVKNCLNGIDINGSIGGNGSDYGYVTMRCSELTNNMFGIIGQDILLDIDNGTQSNGKNANTFTTSSFGHNTQIFNIIYVNRIVNTINARGNYWMAPGSTSTAYTLLTQNSQNQQGFVDLITTPIVTSYPTLLTCIGSGNPGTSGERIYSVTNGTDCEVVRNGHSVVLHDIYSSATSLFDNEDYAQAELTYVPLAEISNAERNTMSTNCRLYIDMAKCRTYVPPAISHSEVLSERSSKSVDNGNLKIYPNPTTNGFTLTTDGVLNQIEVFNTLGQKIYQKTIPTNSYFINTNDWESGIYLVKTKDTSGETLTTRVMVQKEIRN